MACNHIDTDIKHGAFDLLDRVVRHRDVHDHRSKLMHGVVVKRYRRDGCQFGPYPEMYDVQWDHEAAPECGFLPHGIEMEAQRGK